MNVFLTGGTGFIGKSLTRQLLQRDWQVTALVRDPDNLQSRVLVEMGAKVVKGDVTDKESMRAAMTGVDIVVHNAAWYEFGVAGENARKMYEINIDGTEKTLGLAQELGIQRIVYVSSLVAIGDSGPQEWDESVALRTTAKTAYHQSKADAHRIALEFQKQGLPLIIVCLGNVIGPNDHSVWGYFVRLYVNNIMPPMAWSKNNIFRLAFVDDTAEGIVLSAEKGRTGETYFLSGDAVKLHEAFSFWNQFPDGLKFRVYFPVWLAYILFATIEPLERLIGMSAFISRETVLASSINYHYSDQKARTELGWNPRPLRKIWEETLQGEQTLKQARKKRDLVSILKPLDE